MRAVEKRLRERVKELEAELNKVKEDREKFRAYWVRVMKWMIQLQGKGETPSVSWFIEDLSKLLNRVSQWYW
jgi:hypothetical protein